MPQNEKPTQLQVAAVCILAVALLAGLVFVIVFMADKQTSETHENLAKQRAAHPTVLVKKGPAPQPGSPLEPAPHGVEFVRYKSDVGMLGAWLVTPTSKGKHPALLWAHGGFALGAGDLKDIRQFVDSGFVVMLPSWRGENGNPGNFEMCYGEVNDAQAALKYLRSLPQVDDANVFAAGHSVGATSVILLEELTPGLKKVAACGAHPDMFAGEPYDGSPFAKDRFEYASRSPAQHVSDLSSPLLLVYGSDEREYIRLAERMKEDADKAGKKITIKSLDGKDHFTALPAAVPLMIDFFSTN